MTAPATPNVDRRPSQRIPGARNVDNRIHQRRAEFFARHLTPFIEPGQSLVDVGAGDGLLASMLTKSLNLQARAFDVESRGLGPFPVEVYDGTRLPMADASADVSICVAVLHHCDDADAVLREIRRVTRKRFLLVDDRFNSWLDRRCVIGFHHYLKWIESMPFDRRGFRSTKEWEARLANAGFRVSQTLTLGKAVPVFPIINVMFVAEAV